MEEEIDEWDPSQGSFAQHAAAGSAAGLAEHLVMYPVDTVKTVMQARQQQHCTLEHAVQRGGAAGSSSASAAACSCTHCATPLDVAVRLWRSQGGFRLWRGVQTTLTGCIPAHAVYFTMYEGLKPIFTKWLASLRVLPMLLGRSAASGPAGPSDSAQAMGAGAAVAVSTMAHDMIMTPMDVCKQRMQLSSSRCTVYDCARDIMKIEGPRAFYVSYPTTLLMNLPYALIMGTSNEALRKLLSPNGDPSYAAYLAAGAGSGAAAAALTNPLDVVKTRLQTQHLAAPAVGMQSAGASLSRGAPAGAASPASSGVFSGTATTGCGGTGGGGRPAGAGGTTGGSASIAASSGRIGTGGTGGGGSSVACPRRDITYRGLVHVVDSIWREEGYRGFLRGVTPRMVVHAPSVAICWTTYESIKLALDRAGMS